MAVAFLDFRSFEIELLHGSGGFDGSTEDKLNHDLGVKATKEPLQQDMIVGNSEVDRVEGEGEDILVKP